MTDNDPNDTAPVKRGETANHASLKSLAVAWARSQGMTIAAPEVSFPHRKFRVDVAACATVLKAPSRTPKTSISSVLRVAAVFECKQTRSDLIRDNKQREMLSRKLKTLEARRSKLEGLLQVHLPHLANGECLFPEFDSYRLREHRHNGYQKLVRQITMAKSGVIDGAKFDRLLSYRMANLHYLVVEPNLLEHHEIPTGWGLLVRKDEELQLVSKPAWQDINVEHQLVFLQRIAGRKTRSSLLAEC